MMVLTYVCRVDVVGISSTAVDVVTNYAINNTSDYIRPFSLTARPQSA